MGAFMNVVKKLAVAAVLSLGFISQAQAGLLTYTFTGTVQSSLSEFSSLFNAGATGQYVVTFDTSANNVNFMSLSVGSQVLATANSGSYYAGPSGSYTSILQPSNFGGLNNPALLGYATSYVQGNLWSTTSNLFTSGVLPTTAFSLSSFNYLNGVVAGFNGVGGQFNMQFTSVAVNEGAVQTQSGVPAPGALALLGLGLLGIGGLRRKKAA